MPPKKTAEEDAAMYAALLKTCITVVCATEIADTSAKARNYVWKQSNSPDATSSRVLYDRFAELLFPFVRGVAPTAWDLCLWFECTHGVHKEGAKSFPSIADFFAGAFVHPEFVWVTVLGKDIAKATPHELLIQKTVALSDLTRNHAVQYTRLARQTLWDLLIAVILPMGDLRGTMDDCSLIMYEAVGCGRSFFEAISEFNIVYSRLVILLR